jgi:hypothetical protein
MQSHKRQKINEVMERGGGDVDSMQMLLELFGDVSTDRNNGNLFIMGSDPLPVEMTVLDDGVYEQGDSGSRKFHGLGRGT